MRRNYIIESKKEENNDNHKNNNNTNTENNNNYNTKKKHLTLIKMRTNDIYETNTKCNSYMCRVFLCFFDVF